MNILISNDDGIRAEGIARLAAAALPFGRVYVAAPQSQQSTTVTKLTKPTSVGPASAPTK